MGRTAKDRRDMPHPKPVEKIQLSQGNTARRLVAAGLFLLIGAAALAYAFLQLFSPESGWQTIEAGTADGPTCGEDFVFLYELGAGGMTVSAENKAVNTLYTSACRTAFQLFHTMEGFEGVVNLYEINRRPNEALAVDQALYDAFAAVEAAGDRTVYLGPVYARYGGIFSCQDDGQLPDFDPFLSQEVGREYAACAAYARDPEAVGVELLGDNRLRLRVSEDYLAFARREGIDRFLDFGWLKNAFIADYLTQTMAAEGFTHGVISSRDGFARCLDSRERGYGLPLLDRLGERGIQAGTLEYQGPMSLVSLRGFPAAEGDGERYYRLKNGEVRTLYLDPEDGRCKLDADSVTCYSPVHSCAGLAMGIGRAYIADSFRPDPQAKLIGEGAVVIRGRSEAHQFIILGLPGGHDRITGLYEYQDGMRYTVEYDTKGNR